MKSLQTVCLSFATLFATLFATAGLINAQQFTISTVAGIPGVAGLYPVPGDATPTLATAGHLYLPSVVSVDSKGNFYIADSYTYSVRLVTPSTGNISTIAGNGAPGTTGDAGVATSANISDVHGIAVDGNGNVYISDTSTCRIRKIDNPAGTTHNIFTFSGNTNSPFCGASSNSPFVKPGALAFDSKGNLYVADYGSATVKVVTSSGTVTTFAGSGTNGNSGDGGAASKANLAYPVSLVFDAAGNLYIGDEGNSNIRKVDTSGNISTVATGVVPLGMGVDASGNFYFVDGVSSSVRKILATGGVATIAGNSFPGFGGDGGPASLASLAQPSGLAVAPDGGIYVADSGNDVIRKLVAVPSSIGVQDSASELPGSNLLPGFVSSGEILTLFGSGLGPATLTQFTLGSNGFFPTTIAGTSVTVNGTPAPMIYASSGLVAIIAPYEITGSKTANISLTYQGKTYSASMPVAAQTPALFTADTSGTGQAAALNQNLSVNTPANPAKAGSTIVLYATGAGYTTSPVNGQPAPTNCGITCLAVPQLPVYVKIGSQCVTPTYAGAAPSLVAGVLQVNAQIPASTISGPAQVKILVGGSCASFGYPSQDGVTISVTQ